MVLALFAFLAVPSLSLFAQFKPCDRHTLLGMIKFFHLLGCTYRVPG